MNVKEIFKKLTRETSSGQYIPEIDGLRFIAISTVLLYHSFSYFSFKSGIVNNNSNIIFNIWTALCQNGYIGVYLFFAISGYILGKPFAMQYIQKENQVSIKKYFFRRLTRIEPPYLVSLFFLFVISLFIYNLSFEKLFSHFTASFFYVHNLIYSEGNPINGVLWSLEVEIQFYILAPLIGLVFKIKEIYRWLIWVLLIILFSLLSIMYDPELHGFKTLIGYFHYFLAGLLLADIDTSGIKLKNHIPKFIYTFLGTILLLFLLFGNLNIYPYLRPFYCFAIVIFYFLVIKDVLWKKVFSIKFFAVIGGMCYTIYLLHFKVISIIGSIAIHYKITTSFIVNYFFQIIIYTIFIAGTSIVFYLMIEKPTMRKDWYRNIFYYLKSK